MTQTVHIPVMMREALDVLALKKGMTVVDATLGGGGYTRALHEAVMPGGRVISIDADGEAIARFVQDYPSIAKEITIVHSNYVHVRKVLKECDVTHADAIVADLGLSSDQLESAERGFSFLHDGEIDMRLDASDDNLHDGALVLVNTMSLEDLTKIIYRYGEEEHAKKAAQAIIDARPLTRTGELAQVVDQAIGGFYRRKKSSIHAATKTFQALRIAVNHEYTSLENFLAAGMEILTSGGRMSIVSFHSGEDRIVKNVFRAHTKGCVCPVELPLCVCTQSPQVKILYKKPLQPSEEEVRENPRSRSAKLRAIQKN